LLIYYHYLISGWGWFGAFKFTGSQHYGWPTWPWALLQPGLC